MAALQYGLNIRKKGQSGPPKPAPAKRKTIFDDDDDDDGPDADHPSSTTRDGFQEIKTFDDDTAIPTSKPRSIPKVPPPRASQIHPIATTQLPDLATLRTQTKLTASATSLDPSIYDYDAAYDALHARDAALAATAKADAAQRRPKYMEDLLAAAEVRKRDALRAKDRLLQREREAEGDDFADRDAFVTEAYKKQQEEVRRVEEEEARREELEARKRRGKGMGGFYRGVMDEEERRHQEAVKAAEVAAAAGVPLPQGPGLEPEREEKSAAELARELNARGANIVVNDEGQVADKRQLLAAGLNVAARRNADGAAAKGAAAAGQQPGQRPAGHKGATDGQRAMRERQTRMMEAQLEQAGKRAAEEEKEERERVERAAKSRKTEGEVSSARERYLQRKREAAATVAAEKG